MNLKAVIPDELIDLYTEWKMSPGLICNEFLFLTGFTGSDPDGSISVDPETQMRRAFWKVETVLNEAGVDFSSVVEMTTFHIGLLENLDLFKSIRAEYIKEPYPAWTAIEVAGFAREGAVIELKVVATVADPSSAKY